MASTIANPLAKDSCPPSPKSILGAYIPKRASINSPSNQNLPSSIPPSSSITIPLLSFLFKTNKGTSFYLSSITLPLSAPPYLLPLAKLLLILPKLITKIWMPTLACIEQKIHILQNHMSTLKDILQKGEIHSKNAKKCKSHKSLSKAYQKPCGS